MDVTLKYLYTEMLVALTNLITAPTLSKSNTALNDADGRAATLSIAIDDGAIFQEAWSNLKYPSVGSTLVLSLVEYFQAAT